MTVHQDNPFLQRPRDGRPLLGLTHNYPAAGIIEGMCQGWDFVWIDTQHGQHDYRSVGESIRAAASIGVASLLRVPGHEPSELARYADLVPSAVMAPMVNTADEAEHIVQALTFAPRGRRSYGSRRGVDLYGREYYDQTRCAVVLQIETEQAAHHAAEIAAVDGVDALFFGADDMKISFGMPINTSPLDDERLAEAMRACADAANGTDRLAICVAGDAASATFAQEMGYHAIVGGADSAFLRARSVEQLEMLRNLARV